MSGWISQRTGLRALVARRGVFPWLIVAILGVTVVFGAEVMPPAPARHFNDYANVVPASTAQELDKQLSDFEKETSNQILVLVYPKMQSDSSIEDYTMRVLESWPKGVGQKGRDNGAVLFVFIQDRQMFLQVGYGLEGALPDALAKRIIENEIKPRFRAGDYAGGLRAGVNAILAATRGEYKADDRGNSGDLRPILVFFAIFLAFFFLGWLRRGMRGAMYGGRGYTTWGGGWGGGGGWSSGGGGGFSGGGGSFGGGGAGGRW